MKSALPPPAPPVQTCARPCPRRWPKLAARLCPLTSDTMSLEDIFLQITETAPEEAQPEETEESAPEAAAAQPEQSAEPAEPQAPADDTPEQPEAENDQKEEK